MRAADELKDARENGILSREILLFSQKYRSLLVPSPEILPDTMMVLHPLIYLSDKVLPLKCYFNMVQRLQRTAYLARALTQEMTRELPMDDRAQQAASLEAELRAKGIDALTLDLIRESKKMGDLPIKLAAHQDTILEHALLQKLDHEAHRNLCSEDVFVLACAFIEGEVSRQGSIYYLKGESPYFKETKKNRDLVDLSHETSLKVLVSSLARPDEDRGAVECNQLDSGLNHLIRLNRLCLKIHEVVNWMKDGDQKGSPHRKVDVCRRFELTHTDYEWIMTMAHQEGLIPFVVGKKTRPITIFCGFKITNGWWRMPKNWAAHPKKRSTIFWTTSLTIWKSVDENNLIIKTSVL